MVWEELSVGEWNSFDFRGSGSVAAVCWLQTLLSQSWYGTNIG